MSAQSQFNGPIFWIQPVTTSQPNKSDHVPVQLQSRLVPSFDDDFQANPTHLTSLPIVGRGGIWRVKKTRGSGGYEEIKHASISIV